MCQLQSCISQHWCAVSICTAQSHQLAQGSLQCLLLLGQSAVIRAVLTSIDTAQQSLLAWGGLLLQLPHSVFLCFIVFFLQEEEGWSCLGRIITSGRGG